MCCVIMVILINEAQGGWIFLNCRKFYLGPLITFKQLKMRFTKFIFEIQCMSN